MLQSIVGKNSALDGKVWSLTARDHITRGRNMKGKGHGRREGWTDRHSQVS